MSEAMKKGRLVFFVGAGISRIQGYPGWDEYIDNLLVYWQSHLRDSNTNPESMLNVETIRELAKSNISNKRKVDILYQLLENVFDSETFAIKKVEFERYYFNELVPIVTQNPVLTQLSKLDAVYLTTNYDNQIEKHLDDMKTISVPVKDITELTDNITVNSVIHLHGTPSGQVEHFISSSSSYKKHYYSNNPDIERLRRLIKEKELLLIFIGSSMEEDEVLSLLSDGKTKNIAFLTAEETDVPGKNAIRHLIENYHSNTNNTQVYWYGSEFSELAGFIEKLVDDVNRVTYPEAENHELGNWHLFKDVNAEDDAIIDIINDSKNDTLQAYLRDLNSTSDLANQRARQLLASNIFSEKDQEVPFQVWSILLANISIINSEKIDKIIEYVLGNNMSYRYPDVHELIDKLTLKDKTKNRFEMILGAKDDIEYTSFSKNPNILGWKLVFEISKDIDATLFFNNNDLKYNLVHEAVEKLQEYFKDSQSELNMIKFESAEMIVQRPAFGALYQALLKNSITFEGTDWKDGIPDILIPSPIFIKLFMLLYKDKLLPENLVTKIIQISDFSDTKYGQLFNNFYADNEEAIKKQHPGIKKVDYVDGISVLSTGFERERALINEQQLLSLDEKAIVDILVNEEKFLKNEYLQKVYETIDFFKELLQQQTTKVAEIVNNVLKNNVTQLYTAYKKLYIWYLFDEKNKLNLDGSMIQLILGQYVPNKLSSFDFLDADFFENLLKLDDYVEKASRFLLQCDIKAFPDVMPSHGDFTYEEFFQSPIGSFLNLFASIEKEINTLNSNIIDAINDIPFEKVKNFMYGRHYEYFSNEQLQNIFAFKGFSSRYKMSIEMTVVFKDVVISILNAGLHDAWIESNTALVALEQINPLIDVSFDWDKLNGTNMFELIFRASYNFKFKIQWLEMFFKERSEKYFRKLILLFYSSVDVVQNNLKQLISSSFLQKIISASDTIFNLGYIPTNFDKINEDLQELYIELLSQIIKSGRISAKQLDLEVLNIVLTKSQKSERGSIFEVLHKQLDNGQYNRLLTKYPTI
ncbi:SIR2 family protein [Leuconostoc citreum]|uniref:SIR2 family protein n=1 Tax=Leuconostoc citreum TaxID=33964 RepID=UPI003134311D